MIKKALMRVFLVSICSVYAGTLGVTNDSDHLNATVIIKKTDEDGNETTLAVKTIRAGKTNTFNIRGEFDNCDQTYDIEVTGLGNKMNAELNICDGSNAYFIDETGISE